MSLRERLQRIEDRVNALALRERGLLLAAALAVAFLLADTFLLRPLDQRRETTGQQLKQAAERVSRLTESVEQLAGRQRDDPNAELIAERDDLRQQMNTLSDELAALDSGLLTPTQTLDLLRELLADRDDLELISLAKLPAEPLDPDNTGKGIFVHRFDIAIVSDFAGLLDYVRLIESLPRGLYWESLRLSVPEWPANRADLVLYMLALNEDWLGV